MKGEITVKFRRAGVIKGEYHEGENVELTGFNLEEVCKYNKTLRLEPTYEDGFRDGVLCTLNWMSRLCKELVSEIAMSN